MSTEGFTRVWNSSIAALTRTRNALHPTDALESLLERFYDEAVTQPLNTRGLLAAMERLLRYLGSTEGLTHDSLRVTSRFLMPDDEDWEVDWADLPEPIVELVSRVSDEISQAVDDPDWAENFGRSTEELLAQLKAYEAE